MKKAILIICTLLLTHLAVGQSPSPWLQHKVSISVRNMPVAEVLKGLEKDLDGMVFAYSPGAFDVSREVTIKMDSVTLEELLQEVFADQSLECAERRGKIFLKKKKQTKGKGGQAPRKRTIRQRSTASPVQKPVSETSQTRTHSREQRAKEANEASEESPPTQQSKAVVTPPQANTNDTTVVHMKDTAAFAQQDSGQLQETMLAAVERPREQAIGMIEPFSPLEASRVFLLQRQQSLYQPKLPPVPFDSAQSRTPLLYRLGLKKVRSQEPIVINKPEEPESDKPDRKLRLYGASTTALTAIGTEAAIKMGGRAVWLKKNNLGFGLAGYAVQRPLTLDNILDGEYRLGGGYGGVHFEYNLNPNKFVHLSFPLLVGAGGVFYKERDLSNLIPGDEENPSEAIFVVEPGVSLEMNVVKFLKVGLDLTYRLSSSSGLNYESGQSILENAGMNAVSAGFTVKLGIF